MTHDDDARLARAFRDAGIDAQPREDCPDPDRIWAAVRLELPLEDRLAIIDHSTTCPVCAEAWRIAMTLRERDGGARVWWTKRIAGVPAWALAAAASLLLAAGVTLALRVWRGETGNPAIPPKPAAVFALKDGDGQVVLDAEGRIAGLPALPPADLRRMESALRARRLEPSPLLKELGNAGGALMGTGSATRFAVGAPVGTAVESDRPTFRWQPLVGASHYQVVVSDPAAGYREVVASSETQATTWIASQPLSRGRTYVWQVVARTQTRDVKAPAPDEPEARFTVLAQDRADALAAARERYAGRHLVLGLLYYDAGVVDRAREELEALVADNPESAEARSLLDSIRRVQ